MKLSESTKVALLDLVMSWPDDYEKRPPEFRERLLAIQTELPWTDQDTAGIKEHAARVEREAKREKSLLAKRSRLGEMLRAPFAPRFQAEEPAWRKR